MTRYLWTLLAAAGMAAPAAATEPTQLELAMYKDHVRSSCQAQGKQRNDPWPQVQRRCKCIMDTLNAKVSAQDWKRAAMFAHEGKGEEEARIFAPHALAMKACSKAPEK